MKSSSISVPILQLTVFGLLVCFCSVAKPARAFELDSVVYIECTANGKTSRGSGAVIDADGRVLTAKHVVKAAHDANGSECKGALGTQSDENELKSLSIHRVAADRDVALLQFKSFETMRGEFNPISYAGEVEIERGADVVVYGYHKLNEGAADRYEGEVISEAVDEHGKLEIANNTTRGMSGGPVLLDGKLIGIIANEQFDADGEVLATHVVLANEFPEEILKRLEDQDGVITNRILAEHLVMDDVCTQILREQISSRQEEFPEAALIASNLVEPPSSQLSDVADYWVTVTTGPARWADCRTGNMLKTLYFPTGLMLQPERDVVINGTTHTIFVTEHGLRVFLDREAIEPITPEVGFVFATATGVFNVCKRNDTDCSVFEEYLIEEHETQWPFLSGYETYLRSETPEDLDAARKALEALYDYQVDPPSPENVLAVQLDLTKPEDLEACVTREARLFTFFMRYQPDHEQKGSAYQYPVKYSLCTMHDGKAFNRFERIKLVTLAAADERFSQLWAVNTIRQMPQNIQMVTRALFGIERPIASIVTCNEDRFEFVTPGEASRRGPTSLAQLVAAEREDEKTARRHSVIRQFQMTQARSPVDVFKDAPLFNDIELSAACDEDNEIINAGEIIVDLAPLSDGFRLELKLSDLFNVLETSFNNLGLVDADTLNRRLREGIMYRVCSYHEYVIWRTILFNAVKDSDRVREAGQSMGVDLNLMADHVAHLILASVFSTDTRIKNDGRRKEGCA